jgi:predicted GNAT family acetyltransferase
MTRSETFVPVVDNSINWTNFNAMDEAGSGTTSGAWTTKKAESGSSASDCGPKDESEWVEIDGIYIEHDVHRSRFLANIGTGQRPYLSYLIDKSSRTIAMTHTFVPKERRGRGIAKALADRAFMFARKNRWDVIPTCSYISDTYLPRLQAPKPA